VPAICPICRKQPPAPRAASGSPWPFCSERCRLLDLGKWLGEEYRVADGPEGSAGPGAIGAGGSPDED